MPMVTEVVDAVVGGDTHKHSSALKWTPWCTGVPGIRAEPPPTAPAPSWRIEAAISKRGWIASQTEVGGRASTSYQRHVDDPARLQDDLDGRTGIELTRSRRRNDLR
jgi:hypothetical protein